VTGHHPADDGGEAVGQPSCSLTAAGLACDLVRRPWEYPGVRARSAGLLVDDGFFPVEVVPGRPAGEAKVVDMDGRWSVASGAVLTLDEALWREEVATSGDRVLVMATGSNAAPAVMHRKCGIGRVSGVVPFLPATVENVGIGHSAHVSVTGYVAAAPFPAEGVSTQVVVSLLDRRQLACLDRTEPNYERRRLDGRRFPLELATGERPAAYHLYESRWGVVAPGGIPLTLRPQPDLFDRLRELPGAGDVLAPPADVRAVMAGLAGEAGGAARQMVREWLHAGGAVMPARFEGALPQVDPAYGWAMPGGTGETEA
jgi:hypothetical protein